MLTKSIDRFSAPVAARAIDEHGFCHVELSQDRIKIGVAERHVSSIRQGTTFELADRSHIDHLRFWVRAEPLAGLWRGEVGTDPSGS